MGGGRADPQPTLPSGSEAGEGGPRGSESESSSVLPLDPHPGRWFLPKSGELRELRGCPHLSPAFLSPQLPVHVPHGAGPCWKLLSEWGPALGCRANSGERPREAGTCQLWLSRCRGLRDWDVALSALGLHLWSSLLGSRAAGGCQGNAVGSLSGFWRNPSKGNRWQAITLDTGTKRGSSARTQARGQGDGRPGPGLGRRRCRAVTEQVAEEWEM